MNIVKAFRRPVPPSVFDVLFEHNGFSFDRGGTVIKGKCIGDFGGEIATVSGGKGNSRRDIRGVCAHKNIIGKEIENRLSSTVAMQGEYSAYIHVVEMSNINKLSMIVECLVKYDSLCQYIGRPDGDPRLPTDCRMVWS